MATAIFTNCVHGLNANGSLITNTAPCAHKPNGVRRVNQMTPSMVCDRHYKLRIKIRCRCANMGCNALGSSTAMAPAQLMGGRHVCTVLICGFDRAFGDEG